MSISSFVGMGLAALGLVLTPGPNMMYLVGRSVTQGRRAGLISLTGVAVGFFAYLLAVAVGITAVFVAFPAAFTVIKFAGGAYLLYLAWQTIRPGGRSVFAPGELPADPPFRLFTMGLVTNLLNPKIAVLYLSLLPQFVEPALGRVAEQSLLLGLTQIVIAVSVNAAIVLTAGSVAAFLSARPRWLTAQRYVMGAMLAAIAITVLFDRSDFEVSGPDPAATGEPGAAAAEVASDPFV